MTVIDDHGGVGLDSLMIPVANVAPELGGISIAPAVLAVNTMVPAGVSFSDAGSLDTHTATIEWGDGVVTNGEIDSVSRGVSGSHVYAQAGVYTVMVVLVDEAGGSDEAVFTYSVIYDPAAGFVTGGGWINSPGGAYTDDITLVGKASFGFHAKYKKGANTPDGNTQFNFRAGDFNFNSSSYEWLVVAGARAQFKGIGAINGESGYGFMLTAVDGAINGGGGEDKFRIKIWHWETGNVVYDNQNGEADDSGAATALEKGSIVIHKK